MRNGSLLALRHRALAQGFQSFRFLVEQAEAGRDDFAHKSLRTCRPLGGHRAGCGRTPYTAQPSIRLPCTMLFPKDRRTTPRSRLWHLAIASMCLSLLGGCGGNASSTGPQYSVGGTVTGLAMGRQLVLSNSGNQSLTVTANGAFQFSYPNIAGTPYAVTISSQPVNQSCSLTNGSGRANATVSNIAVTCTASASRYVYAVNGGDSTIAGFTLDSGTGLLSTLSSINGNNASNTAPSVAVMAPSGNALYVLNPKACCAASAEVTAFTVDNASGTLSFASSVVVGNQATGMTVDGTGSYLYVARYDGAVISSFAIDTGTGVFTSVGDASLAFGAAPMGLAADPGGKFVYSANSGSDNVTAWRIGTGGVLTSIGTTPAGASPQAVAVDPSGRFAYSANSGDNTVTAFRINTTTGALTKVANTTLASAPIALSVAPNGRWLVAASAAGKSVTVLGINSTTGALTTINTVTLAGTANAVAVDASSRYAFVTSSSDNALSTLQLDSTSGQLSFAGSVSAGNAPKAVVVAPGP